MHKVILFTYWSALPEVIADVLFGGGASFQSIHLDGLRCTVTEPKLLNCTHSGTGVHNCGSRHSEDVGIICAWSQGNGLKIRKQHYNNIVILWYIATLLSIIDCRDGSVRLVDGDNYNAAEDRVECCVGGLWGTVCDYQWDAYDAEVNMQTTWIDYKR